MPIRDALLPEFDHEMATTRRLLERVPDGQPEWRPHPKSSPLGRLSTHIAELPGWVVNTITRTELDLAPPDGKAWTPLILGATREVLALFDRNVAEARAALAAADDVAFAVGWSLKMGPRVIFTQPRAAVYRSFVMSHLIHHRAQLGVYLRLLGVPVPGSYGPSADETGMAG